MDLNTFRPIFRNAFKQIFYTTINIGGLAVGLAVGLLILLFVQDELNYDTYNKHADRIFRIDREIKFGDNYAMTSLTPPGLSQALTQDYPEIEAVVRFCLYGSYLVKSDFTDNIKEGNVVWADSSFFKVFTVTVNKGDARTALKVPASVAISERMAEKFFPDGNALGKPLRIDNEYNTVVTAVFENMPNSSHFHFDVVISMEGDWPVPTEAKSNNFLRNNFSTYVLLNKSDNGRTLEAKLPQFVEKYIGPDLAALGSTSMSEFKAVGNKLVLTLMPLQDIHLHSNFIGDFEPNGNNIYTYLFGVAALFIIIIACINFMNLSTARSARRAKEVGIRKVLGSSKFNLFSYFITESMVHTTTAFVIAIGISFLMLPSFNEMAAKSLHLSVLDANFLFILMVAIVAVGLLAGAYPSLVLTTLKPISALKGTITPSRSGGFMRSTLVVFQFLISILLIVSAVSVARQVNYIQNKNLGFDKEQVIIVHDTYALRPNKIITFKEETLRNNELISATISSFIPVEGIGGSQNDRPFWKEGANATTDNLVNLQTWSVDLDYLKTFEMQITTGRDFSGDFLSDSTGVILNETAVSLFDLGKDPVGKRIYSFEGGLAGESQDAKNIKYWTVIGIVKDFHYSSLKESIYPLGFFLGKSDHFISFRYKAQKSAGVISSLGAKWKSLAPDQPFQFSFLDEDFGRMYASEQRLKKIFYVFGGLAILIACLGLLGLTSFTTEQRRKEIGIRKILGGSVFSIVVLLTRQLSKLVIIAFVISVPLSWFGINWWLDTYIYKTTPGILTYFASGLGVMLVSWLSMIFQVIRAAFSNPVTAIRIE